MTRAWDTFDAYLFDIDGTLLHCKDAVHYFGFCQALTAVAGRPINLDGVVTHGNVDPAILRDALTRAEVPENIWLPKIKPMQESVAAYVEAHAAEFNIDVLPGVPALLRYLKLQDRLLGVATGNLERIGWAKLQAANLRDAFSFGGFSDRCSTRTAVFAQAAHTARVLLDNSQATLCVFGDTPADIEAAHANNLAVIAVATGVYEHAALAAHNPDWHIASMEDLLPGSSPDDPA